MFDLVKTEEILLTTLGSILQKDIQKLPGISLKDITQYYSHVFNLHTNNDHKEVVSLALYVHKKTSYPWKMCLDYIIDGECKNKDHCAFKHSLSDQRSTPQQKIDDLGNYLLRISTKK